MMKKMWRRLSPVLTLARGACTCKVLAFARDSQCKVHFLKEVKRDTLVYVWVNLLCSGFGMSCNTQGALRDILKNGWEEEFTQIGNTA